ncbi:TetR/AcrR family transcriptional regulator [Pseudochelatococcus lubricantis]|uniref:TetR/AcrR family transcriptional regulator n=1 Tax=Pseudochelatococcus lubricantis TaxID=1538102 RepID=UPI0035E913F4
MVQKIENARERFGRAAIEVFHDRGYAETTVADIAAAAGLTERTFFRYFIDKPEVLFWRADELEAEIIGAVREAEDARPLEVVVSALETAGNFFDANRADVIARQAIVAANAEFHERELMKMRSLAAAIATTLEERAIPTHLAVMAAEVGVLIWRIAIDRWCSDGSSADFGTHVRASLKDLVAVAIDQTCDLPSEK